MAKRTRNSADLIFRYIGDSVIGLRDQSWDQSQMFRHYDSADMSRLLQLGGKFCWVSRGCFAREVFADIGRSSVV